MKSLNESLKSYEPVNEGILGDLLKGMIKNIKGWPVFVHKDDDGADIADPVISPLFSAKAIGDGYAGDHAYYVDTPSTFIGKLLAKFGIKSASAKQIIDDFTKTKKSIFEGLDLDDPKTIANICEAFTLGGQGIYGPDVETPELIFHLKSAIANPGFNPPLMIWGAPGIGKTAIVNSVVNAYAGKKRLITKNLSDMTPDEFTLPNVVKDESGNTKEVEDLPKTWLPVYRVSGDADIDAINDNVANGGTKTDDGHIGDVGDGGVIFFDEIGRCRPDVQGVALTLTQDRALAGGKYKLGSKWTIVAASNRDFDENGDFDIRFSKALGNRFEQVNFVPTLKDWLKWAEKKDYMSKVVLNFIKFNEKYWYNMNPEDDDQHVFASPRSWENCCKTLYAIKNCPDAADADPAMIERICNQAIQAIVGDKAATEFIAFMKLCDSVDVEGLTNVTKDYKKAPKLDKKIRLDLKYYMVDVAISSLDPTKPMTLDTLMNICSWLGESGDPNVISAGWSKIDNLFPDVKFKCGDERLKNMPRYKDHWDDFAPAFNKLIELCPAADKEIKINI